MSIRYFTQIRHITTCKKHGTHTTPWDDACTGHDTYNDAVTCQELMTQALAGKITRSPLMSDSKMEITNLLGELMTLSFQLVKRTTTDEVLDA